MALSKQEIQQLADGKVLPRALTPDEVKAISEEPYRMLFRAVEGKEVSRKWR